MKISIEYLISICSILILLFVSFFLVFNAYAQQGGVATGGGAQFNQGSGMTITCTVNNACVFTGGPATGGPATGGNAIGSGNSNDNTSNNPNQQQQPLSPSTTNISQGYPMNQTVQEALAQQQEALARQQE